MKLYYHSAPWCAPCKTKRPAIEKVVEDFPNVEFVYLNVDEEDPRVAIHSVPTLVLEDERGNVLTVIPPGAVTPAAVRRVLAQ